MQGQLGYWIADAMFAVVLPLLATRQPRWLRRLITRIITWWDDQVVEAEREREWCRFDRTSPAERSFTRTRGDSWSEVETVDLGWR